ncbi:exo-beta-N-acetylmuramidase NamZ family protein [Arachidicoccus ginsenosidimutans]|uniref:exo-beta-N-acetylmuramidase NamZ family protein n=1 Tax=Arachidicoccus sp. BS20 TaxID=1850526 RepID=UPI000A910424|nr:DUF1343 domain-containing protein [Arachidicoccus sp. BS20]
MMAQQILPAAYQTENYLPLLKNKTVGVFANPTSEINGTPLVDSLLSLGTRVVCAFGPEHGFRGDEDAGAKVGNEIDKKTGIKIISLYGKKTKPSEEDVKNVDVLLFDLQDVGVRFYTYIASLQHFMEAAIDLHKPLIILDRPNPNGFYIDGPILDRKYASGVGEQPIPVVYGMTIGEYAKMLIGEHWLNTKTKYDAKSVDIKIIPCKNYTHESRYMLPVKPSPNLPFMSSVYKYPSMCFFEGTVLSEGRGTEFPFEIFGHPSLDKSLFSFTPEPRKGAESSKFYGQVCYGWNIHDSVFCSHLVLKYLLQAYKAFPDKQHFFISQGNEPTKIFFNKLAGSDELMKQIIAGRTEAQIRRSWRKPLKKFMQIRKKYLLYP